MTEEGKIQKKITDRLKKDGWFVTKLMQTSTNGIPDVLAVRQNETLWVEVKTPTGRLSEIQKYRISELDQKFGQHVYVSYSYAEFNEQYEQYLKIKNK